MREIVGVVGGELIDEGRREDRGKRLRSEQEGGNRKGEEVEGGGKEDRSRRI